MARLRVRETGAGVPKEAEACGGASCACVWASGSDAQAISSEAARIDRKTAGKMPALSGVELRVVMLTSFFTNDDFHFYS